MAITDAYATAAEYREAVNKTDTTKDTYILRILKAVSRYLDRELNQFFGFDAAVVARVLGGSGYGYIDLTRGGVPGLATATGLIVEVDTAGDLTYATTLVNANLRLLPLTAALGPEPKPFTELELTSLSSIGSFESNNLVRITGKWGWPAVPEAIWASTIEIAAIWMGESPRATGRMNELDQVVQASPLAMQLVRRLKAVYTMPVVA